MNFRCTLKVHNVTLFFIQETVVNGKCKHEFYINFEDMLFTFVNI